MNNYDYKYLTPFKWFILENFPFIEADFDALTNWQLFCKLGNEMNKIIDRTNLTGEQVEILTNAFNELKSYVDNYFENLDVQEEINNRLDEMAQTGELQSIITRYFDSVDAQIQEQNNVINRFKSDVNTQLSDFRIETNNSIATQNSEISMLDERIAEIAKLPSGSTSGDAELQDIRVGFNGITYSSAGNAVRGQATENNKLINYFYDQTYQNVLYIDGTQPIKVNTIVQVNGTESTNSNFDSIKIPCHIGQKFLINASLTMPSFKNDNTPMGALTRTQLDTNLYLVKVDKDCDYCWYPLKHDQYGIRMVILGGYYPSSYIAPGKVYTLMENTLDISSVQDKVDKFNDDYNMRHIEFELGLVNTSLTNVASNNYFRSKTFYAFKKNEILSTLHTDATFKLLYCDSTGTQFISETEFSQSKKMNSNCYAYIVGKEKNTSNIADTFDLYAYCFHTYFDNSHWKNKIWYSFGTSMSDINTNGTSGNNGTRGKWPLFIDEVSGMYRTNKAIGSGGIVPSAPHGGNVKQNIMNCPYDVDLVTFECGLNDWTTITLGEIGDKSNDTFIGNFTQCIEYLTYHTRAKLVFISMIPVTYTSDSQTTRRSPFYTNSFGYTYRDYIDAMIKICKIYGVEVIDAQANAMSNGRQNPYTIDDTVHFTNLGGQIYGRYIWEKLKNIVPMPVFPEPA